MYTRLTKKITLDSGSECISCVNLGTTQCQLHNGVPDCSRCPMLAAIFNQLHAFEEAYCGETESESYNGCGEAEQIEAEH